MTGTEKLHKEKALKGTRTDLPEANIIHDTHAASQELTCSNSDGDNTIKG